MTVNDATTYCYPDAQGSHAHAYLLPKLTRMLGGFFAEHDLPRRVFDLGCGNGSVASLLHSCGYEVHGVDPSTEGIAQAHAVHPHLDLREGSAYDNLSEVFGSFPAVYSLEVVEHVYDPRKYARTLYSITEPGGLAIVSTPYHGYFKNLVMAATGKLDAHFTALWDHGHIKFWSVKTLGHLLREAGFESIEFHRVGRISVLAKSMIACAYRPA